MRALNVSVARPQPVPKPKNPTLKGTKDTITPEVPRREAPAHSYNRVMLGTRLS